MKLKLIQLLLFIFTLKECFAANILAVFQLPGKNHFSMFSALLKGLAKKGHDVDVVSHFPLENPIEGYNDISIRSSLPLFTECVPLDLAKIMGIKMSLVARLGADAEFICENSFKTSQLHRLRNSTKLYDVVITELFHSDCMLGWAWHFKVPSIVMTSSANYPWANDRFGLPDNPSYIPTALGELGPRMTFFERIANFWAFFTTKIAFDYYSARSSEKIARKFFGENMPDLSTLAYNTSLQIINTHFSIDYARPWVPNIIEVAGIHIESPKPLNMHFSEVLKTDRDGIIYLSMGSLVIFETFPLNMLQAMFDAFSELPYKVIWKSKKENFPAGLTFPENIHFEAWYPQLDILCDPRVKLFISHGGMMGFQEAVYCGVPILGLPLFGDQWFNAKRAENMGFGKVLDYKTLTKNEFLSAVEALLYDERYSENAKKVSEEFKDRPLSALDTAIYWVEYVIRHKGAPKLQSSAKYLSWYQYYLLDVIAIILGLPCVLIYATYRIIVLIQSKTKTAKTKRKKE